MGENFLRTPHSIAPAGSVPDAAERPRQPSTPERAPVGGGARNARAEREPFRAGGGTGA